jgi:hypothetical protein
VLLSLLLFRARQGAAPEQKFKRDSGRRGGNENGFEDSAIGFLTI